MEVFMRNKPWPTPSMITPSPPVTPPPPPRELTGPGRDVWDRITREFHIDDSAAREVLQQVCEAVNRLEAIAVRVRTDGEVIPDGKGGHRSHPSLRDEILNRGFICKTLRNLGVLNGPRKFG
jgi:hypothetical protein